MINGKFFSGLPPGMMMNRGGDGAGKNRLESHLFWPDDSQAIPATEMRLKRTNSVQYKDRIDSSPLSRQTEQQPEMNTKRMFHREFAKSSIQFCDDLEEQPEPRHQPWLRSKQAKHQLALKPSATPLKALADDVVDGPDSTYMKAKKQQAFVSRIEFNDYAEDELNKINNHKPRVDKNDKRQLERNTKNIPKLQSKSNVKNLEVVNAEDMEKMLTNFEPVGKNKQRTYAVGDDNVPHDAAMPIKLHTNKNDRQYPDHFLGNKNSSDYGNEPDLNYIQNNMKTLRLQPEEGRRKKQLCGDQNNYEFEDCHTETNFGRYYDKSNDTRLTRQPGTNLRHSQNRRIDHSRNEGIVKEAHEHEPYMETSSLKPMAPTFKTHNNTLYEFTNNRHQNDDCIQDNNQVQKPGKNTTRIFPRSSLSRTSNSEALESELMDTESLATQLHRSNNASRASMEGDGGPASPISNNRRTARNSATQRVSVGLPD